MASNHRDDRRDRLPTPPLEAEYPTGWWHIYVIAVLLSMLASALWPGVWFGG